MRREASVRLSHVASDAGSRPVPKLSIGLASPIPLIKATAVADRLLTNVLREQPSSSFAFMPGIIRQVLWVRDLGLRIGADLKRPSFPSGAHPFKIEVS